MKQYFENKDKYPNHILFFRIGDFYEMFYDDAVKVSRELGLTLTGKDCGQEERAPMCGVPYHAADTHIKKLVDRGYKVAVCEQTEDPKNAKGLVDRDIIKIVTPGTLTDSSMLTDDSNNYICGIWIGTDKSSVCFSDISTGEVCLFTFPAKDAEENIINRLASFAPAEVVFNDRFLDMKNAAAFIRSRLNAAVQLLDDADFDPAQKLECLLKQFCADDISDLGEDESDVSEIHCLCGLFSYIADTQKAAVGRFSAIVRQSGAKYMELDMTARNNLEISKTLRSGEKKGTLLWVLDRTKTAMGKRMLKNRIERPLLNPAEIIARLTAVEQLCGNTVARNELSDALSGIYDIERLMTRVMYRTATPRDLKALQQTAEKLPEIKSILDTLRSPLLKSLNEKTDTLSDISSLINNSISDEPPAQLKDGGVIKDGFNEELDHYRQIIGGGKSIIEEIEKRERERTGIKNLKVSYNRVFGYYIEVTKSNYSLVPNDYVRRQTLANCERFITDELKKAENEMAGANEKIAVIESDIFNEIRDYAASQLARVQQTAAALADLDVLCCFAEVSVRNGYVRPDIAADGIIDIRDGRHPVVEQVLTDEPYVPNNVYLNQTTHRMAIITGPNMSGKSTYMRQTALIVLMAQAGCFVPAQSAKISVCDRIFTRIGASDDLTGGQSTFMVEMSEVANILKNATKNSLVILDEVGRGTSTFDGISIASAVAEYIAGNRRLGCKTLFATHYHELIGLEERLEGVRNYSIAVCRRGDDIKFLRKIAEGGTDDSYGIEVAKLAGLPPKVISRARELLSEMEAEKKNGTHTKKDDDQISFGEINDEDIIGMIKKTNPDELSGEEALDFLREIYHRLTK